MKVFISLVILFVVMISFQNCSEVDFAESQNNSVLPSGGPGDPVAPEECVDLKADDVQPIVKWDWQAQLGLTTVADQYPHFNQVMASPTIGDLDGDGIPEIVTTMFSRSEGHFAEQVLTSAGNPVSHYHRNGALRVLDGATGNTKFSIVGDSVSGTDKDIAPKGTTTPLLIDLNIDGKLEIVYVHYLRKKVIALNHDGSRRWIYDLPFTLKRCLEGFSAIQLPGGGTEFVVGNLVLVEAGGVPVVKATLSETDSTKCGTFGMSLDPAKPGAIQIIGPTGVYDPSGTQLFSLRNGFHTTADVRSDYPGLEVVTVSGGVIDMVDGVNGSQIFQKNLNLISDLKCNATTSIGGGPATIGNFDEDPATIEIATATGKYLIILDAQGNLIDQFETQDCSSKITGITSFDFNGDGKPEILYGDEEYLRVFEIRDGALTEIIKLVNPSGTLSEYPIVADVNGDSSAEIILVSNNYVVESARWYNDVAAGESEADREIARGITGIRVFEPKTEKCLDANEIHLAPVFLQSSYDK